MSGAGAGDAAEGHGADPGSVRTPRPEAAGREPGAFHGPVEFCGLELAHPVVNGSGTFDAIAARRAFGDEAFERFPFSAFVSKTITLEPRAGNPPPRLWEAPAGLINSIGLPGKGADGFIAEDLPELAQLPCPLIVSVMATTRDDFARLVELVSSRDEVAALELNVSCPNVKSGLVVGESAEETSALVERVRPITRKPLIVKLSPNPADQAGLARAAAEAGADAVSLINTLRAVAMAPGGGGRWLGAGSGGLSGPAVRPVALAQVAAVAEAVDVPIVGMGGITNAAEAADFMAVGARLVAIGTQSFVDPRAAERIASELAAHLRE